MVSGTNPHHAESLYLPATASTPAGLASWRSSKPANTVADVSFRDSAVIAKFAATRVRIPASAFSWRGFCSWADSAEFPGVGSYSFLNGTLVVDMSPEEIECHNKIKTEITYVIEGINKRDNLGTLYSDRASLANSQAQLVSEPDCMLATWETLRSGKLQSVPGAADLHRVVRLEGTPDWVLEIVSDSSVRKDTVALREAYHTAGIPEYWLIDARGDDIDFRILVRDDEGYQEVSDEGGWLRSPVLGHAFRLERMRNPIDLWQYTLHIER